MTASAPESVMDLLATYFVGGASNTALSDAAVRAMEAGVDTPALRMLAGLSGATDAWELENLIGRMLRELGMSQPDRSSMVRLKARPLARAFLAGRITPDAFADGLYELSRHDVREGHHPWCLLQDDWMLARDGTAGTVDEAMAALREEAERLVGSRD